MRFPGKSRATSARTLLNRATAAVVEALDRRDLLSGTTPTGGPIITPAHVVIVVEEDRFANAIGDTSDMPYLNQLAASGLAYSNSHGLNTSSQDGEMSYLGLFSGSTQGVTDNAYHGPFSGGNLAQSLNNAGLSFASYAEGMPRAGDTTDNYAPEPGNPAYDDLYVRAYNPASQFTNVGTGKTNAQVNQTFASFPTTASGYAGLPSVSFVIPDTLHNTHGSNDTDPYATDPSQYDFLRQNADAWLQQHLNGYAQWAKQNNSLLIITGDEGDRAHNFAAGFATIIAGSSNVLVAGTDAKSVTPYNLLRTVEDMYGVAALGNSASAADYDTDATGRLAPTGGLALAGTATSLSSSANPAIMGQPVTFTATVTSTSGTPAGTVSFLEGATTLGTGTLNASGVATFTTSTLVAGSHSITASYAGSSSFAGSASAPVTQAVQVPVTGVALNGNNAALAGAQRSMVDSIVYTFSQPVTLASTNAFVIGVHAGETGTVPSLAWAAINPDANGGSTQWVVTFGGNGVSGGSIANGVYDITLNTTAISVEGNPAAAITPRATDTFFRLFGDIDGNESVSTLDYGRFKQALNGAYNPAFDYDGNGSIATLDYGRFKQDMPVSYFGDGFVTTI
jgi:hypothetical protein